MANGILVEFLIIASHKMEHINMVSVIKTPVPAVIPPYISGLKSVVLNLKNVIGADSILNTAVMQGTIKIV